MQASEPTLEALANRVTKLEAQNRRLKKTGITALLVGLAFIVMGQSKPDQTIEVDTVKARKVFADVISLSDKESDSGTLLLPGSMIVQKNKGKDSVSIDSSGAGPSLHLSDHEGFQTVLGVSSLVTSKTGETHQRSAASVVLFGKDKNVLWSAP